MPGLLVANGMAHDATALRWGIGEVVGKCALHAGVVLHGGIGVAQSGHHCAEPGGRLLEGGGR